MVKKITGVFTTLDAEGNEVELYPEGTLGSDNSVTLTRAEYDALSDAEKNSDTTYYISDEDAQPNAFSVPFTSDKYTASNTGDALIEVKTELEETNSNLIVYDDKNDSLIVWSNGNIVGTIACNFKFDGNFINVALSEWTLVNSTLSASLGNLILKATGASETNPINYYAICNRQKRIFAGDKLYIVAQITAKGGQGLLVYISTDDGNNWIEIYRAINNTNNAFSIDKQIDLSSYEGENIKVKLVANSYNTITSISFSNLAIG